VLWWVCLFVCLYVWMSAGISQKPHCQTWPIFCACCPSPWLRPLTALQYVMCFRFCGWRHFVTQWRLVHSQAVIEYDKHKSQDSNQILFNKNTMQQVLIVRYAHGPSLLSTIAFLCMSMAEPCRARHCCGLTLSIARRDENFTNFWAWWQWLSSKGVAIS